MGRGMEKNVLDKKTRKVLSSKLKGKEKQLRWTGMRRECIIG